jgi:hypothetical protein
MPVNTDHRGRSSAGVLTVAIGGVEEHDVLIAMQPETEPPFHAVGLPRPIA